MSSGSTKPPEAPDPELMAQLQNDANRVNQVGPWGSTTFSEDENGRATQTQQLSPQMQAVMDRMFTTLGDPSQQAQKYEMPQGFSQLQGAIGNKVGERYGLQAKPQEQSAQQPSMAMMQKPQQAQQFPLAGG